MKLKENTFIKYNFPKVNNIFLNKKSFGKEKSFSGLNLFEFST